MSFSYENWKKESRKKAKPVQTMGSFEDWKKSREETPQVDRNEGGIRTYGQFEMKKLADANDAMGPKSEKARQADADRFARGYGPNRQEEQPKSEKARQADADRFAGHALADEERRKQRAREANEQRFAGRAMSEAGLIGKKEPVNPVKPDKPKSKTTEKASVMSKILSGFKGEADSFANPKKEDSKGTIRMRGPERGFFDKDNDNDTLPEKSGASLRRGTARTIESLAGATRWLGGDHENNVLATGLQKTADKFGKGFDKEQNMYSKDFKFSEAIRDPEFYATSVTEAVPQLLTSIIPGIGTAKAADWLLKASKMKTVSKTIIKSIAGAGAATTIDSAIEAGSVYDEALRRGMTEEQAKSAANETFGKNFALTGGTTFGEFMLGLSPIGRGLSRAGKVGSIAARTAGGSLLEAGQEGSQEWISASALGDDFSWADPTTIEAMTIGAILGGGVTGSMATATELSQNSNAGNPSSGNPMTDILERTILEMPIPLQTELYESIFALREQGMEYEEALGVAMEEMAKKDPAIEALLDGSAKRYVQEEKNKQQSTAPGEVNPERLQIEGPMPDVPVQGPTMNNDPTNVQLPQMYGPQAQTQAQGPNMQLPQMYGPQAQVQGPNMQTPQLYGPEAARTLRNSNQSVQQSAQEVAQEVETTKPEQPTRKEPEAPKSVVKATKEDVDSLALGDQVRLKGTKSDAFVEVVDASDKSSLKVRNSNGSEYNVGRGVVEEVKKTPIDSANEVQTKQQEVEKAERPTITTPLSKGDLVKVGNATLEVLSDSGDGNVSVRDVNGFQNARTIKKSEIKEVLEKDSSESASRGNVKSKAAEEIKKASGDTSVAYDNVQKQVDAFEDKLIAKYGEDAFFNTDSDAPHGTEENPLTKEEMDEYNELISVRDEIENTESDSGIESIMESLKDFSVASKAMIERALRKIQDDMKLSAKFKVEPGKVDNIVENLYNNLSEQLQSTKNELPDGLVKEFNLAMETALDFNNSQFGKSPIDFLLQLDNIMQDGLGIDVAASIPEYTELRKEKGPKEVKAKEVQTQELPNTKVIEDAIEFLEDAVNQMNSITFVSENDTAMYFKGEYGFDNVTKEDVKIQKSDGLVFTRAVGEKEWVNSYVKYPPFQKEVQKQELPKPKRELSREEKPLKKYSSDENGVTVRTDGEPSPEAKEFLEKHGFKRSTKKIKFKNGLVNPIDYTLKIASDEDGRTKRKELLKEYNEINSEEVKKQVRPEKDPYHGVDDVSRELLTKYQNKLRQAADKSGIKLEGKIRVVSNMQDKITESLLESHGIEDGTRAYVAGKAIVGKHEGVLSVAVDLLSNPDAPITQEVIHEFAEVWTALWKQGNPSTYNRAIKFLTDKGMSEARAEEMLTELITDHSINNEIPAQIPENRADISFFKRMTENFKSWVNGVIERITYFREQVWNQLPKEIQEQAEMFSNGDWESAFSLVNDSDFDSTTRYSVKESVVEPSSDLWKRGPSFEEVKTMYPKLFEAEPDAETTDRHPTQIATTVSTYNQFFDHLEGEGFNGTIIDASSGLGRGTEAGKQRGLKIEDVEPFPDKDYQPKYTDYADIKEQYDVVISNAVLNVIPQDVRDSVVKDIGRLLKDGGRAFINVRGRDVENAKGKKSVNEKDAQKDNNMEYFIEGRNSYQKGFNKKELVAYLEDVLSTLPGEYDVQVMNKKNSGFNAAVGAVVTRLNGASYSVKEIGTDPILRDYIKYFGQVQKAGNAEAKPTKKDKKKQRSASGVTYTENGTEINFVYRIVDANELISSNNTDMTVNEDYPQELQPRDRSRKASQEQIQRIAQKLNPELLGESAKASDGAPIIGEDMIVESGNGRTIALKKMYKEGYKTTEAYNEFINEFASVHGLNVLAENPVLVRVRTNEVDRRQFVSEANESNVATMSAAEQAKVDAKKMTNRVMSLFNPAENGDLNVASNRAFITAFIGEVTAKNDRGRLLTADGNLSQDGLLRVRNAVLAKAYNDVDAISLISESTDNNVRTITNAMLQSAPRFAIMKDKIASGDLFDLDITTEIVEAMTQLAALRTEGTAVKTFLDQTSMFEELSDLSKDVLTIYDAKQFRRSTKALNDLFNQYVDVLEAAGNPKQESLFENTTPTKAEVLEVAMKRVTANEEGQAQIDLFQDENENSDGTRKTNGKARQEKVKDSSVDTFVRARGSGRKAKPNEPAKETFTEPIGTPEDGGRKEYSQSPESDDRSVMRSDIIEFIMKEFKVAISLGKTRRHAGIYKNKFAIIRTKEYADFEVLSHELGHRIDERLGLSTNPALRQELVKFAEANLELPESMNATQRAKEGVAEWFRQAFYGTHNFDLLTEAELETVIAFNQVSPELELAIMDGLTKVKWYEPTLKLRSMIQSWLGRDAEQELRGIVTPIGRTRREKKTVRRFFDEVYANWFERDHPFHMANRAIEKETGKKITGRDNAYSLKVLTRGTTGRAATFVEGRTFDWNGVENGESFEAILSDVDNIEEFGHYLVARHGLDLKNNHGKKKTPISEDMTPEYLERMESKYGAQAERVYAYQNRLLQVLVDGGLIDPDLPATLRKKYPNYVPFYREMAESGVREERKGGVDRASVANLQQGINRMSAEGSTRNIINPIESIVRNTHLFFALADRNSVGRALANLADPDSPYASEAQRDIIEEVPNSFKVTEIALKQIEKTLLNAGLDEDILEEIDMEQTAKVFNPLFKPNSAQNEVLVWVDGKPKLYKIRDSMLYNELIVQDSQALNDIINSLYFKTAKASAQALRTGITASPFFTVRTFIRSWHQLMVKTEAKGFNYVTQPVRTIKSMYDVTKKTDLFWDWMSSGGAQSTFIAVESEYLDRKMNNFAMNRKAKDILLRKYKPQSEREAREIAWYMTKTAAMSPLRGLQRFNDTLDQALKLAEYNVVMKQTGGNRTEAALASREADVDYRRFGKSGIRHMNQITPFFNVSFQGPENVVRSFVKHPLRNSLRAIAFVVAPTLLLYLHNRDDEDYQELNSWEKDLNWMIKKPNGEFWKIPIPFEVGILFKAIPEKVFGEFLDYVEGEDKQNWDDFYSNISKTLLPSFIPTVFDVWAKAKAEKDLMNGRPYVPLGLQQLEKPDQYTENTSAVAKWVGKKTNKSPLVLEETFNAQFGQMGQFYLWGIDNMLAASGVVDKPDTKGLKNNYAKRYVTSSIDDGGTGSLTSFYENYKKLDSEYKSSGVKFDPPELLKAYNAANKDIGNLRKLRNAIMFDKMTGPDGEKFTKAQKKQQIDIANKGMRDIARMVQGKEPLEPELVEVAWRMADDFADYEKAIDKRHREAKKAREAEAKRNR